MDCRLVLSDKDTKFCVYIVSTGRDSLASAQRMDQRSLESALEERMQDSSDSNSSREDNYRGGQW